MSLLTSIASGLVREVGVSVGDLFRYHISVMWSSSDPNATFPPLGKEELLEENDTEWILFSIQNITHTSVSMQKLRHFRNGTEKIDWGYVDVELGFGNMSTWIVASNLSVNDSVYASSPYFSWIIADTTQRSYVNGTRETNHFNKTDVYSLPPNGTLYENTDYYWDRISGIIVEYRLEEIRQIGEYQTTWSLTYRIIESNVWVVPEFPSLTAIFAALAGTTAVAFVYMRIRKNVLAEFN